MVQESPNESFYKGPLKGVKMTIKDILEFKPINGGTTRYIMERWIQSPKSLKLATDGTRSQQKTHDDIR